MSDLPPEFVELRLRVREAEQRLGALEARRVVPGAVESITNLLRSTNMFPWGLGCALFLVVLVIAASIAVHDYSPLGRAEGQAKIIEAEAKNKPWLQIGGEKK